MTTKPPSAGAMKRPCCPGGPGHEPNCIFATPDNTRPPFQRQADVRELVEAARGAKSQMRYVPGPAPHINEPIDAAYNRLESALEPFKEGDE